MKDNKSFLSSASLISALTSVGTPFSFPQAHRKPFGWKATTARCPCWSPRLPCSCPPLAALVLYVNQSTIIAIILLILRSFQRKGLCDSSLKAKSITFVVPYNGEDNNDYVDGEVVQHIEYVPFGEVFVEERNNISNNPLRRERNGKR